MNGVSCSWSHSPEVAGEDVTADKTAEVLRAFSPAEAGREGVSHQDIVRRSIPSSRDENGEPNLITRRHRSGVSGFDDVYLRTVDGDNCIIGTARSVGG